MGQEHQIVNLYTWVILSTKHRKKAFKKSGFNGSGVNPWKSLDRFTYCCLVWYGLVCIAATTAWSSGIRLIDAVGKTWEYHLRYFGCYNTTATSFFSETPFTTQDEKKSNWKRRNSFQLRVWSVSISPKLISCGLNLIFPNWGVSKYKLGFNWSLDQAKSHHQIDLLSQQSSKSSKSLTNGADHRYALLWRNISEQPGRQDGQMNENEWTWLWAFSLQNRFAPSEKEQYLGNWN